MVTAAAFYSAVTTWLSLKGLSNYKLSDVTVLHKLGGMRQYSASIVSDSALDSAVEEPEVYEKIFRNGSLDGYVLIDIATGELYSEDTMLNPNWRIQLTYLTVKYDNSTAERDDDEVEKPLLLNNLPIRRFYNHPHVEIGPGGFKHEIVSYPPNFLQMNLKKLMKLKQKMEDKLKEG